VEHGGSYLETSEWWTVPRHFSLAGELRLMIPEMLFLKGLRDSNRPLWYRSFPFHFGLYLMAGSVTLLVLTALVSVMTADGFGVLGSVLRGLTTATGISGLGLSLAGACALLHRRLTDVSLRSYTTPGDIFNLLFFIMSLGLISIGYVVRPEGSPGALAIAPSSNRSALIWRRMAMTAATTAPPPETTIPMVLRAPRKNQKAPVANTPAMNQTLVTAQPGTISRSDFPFLLSADWRVAGSSRLKPPRVRPPFWRHCRRDCLPAQRSLRRPSPSIFTAP
jgi:nitrate reductase gamma subunit